MTLAQALKKLEAAGTAQNRKVYARHGVRAEVYGRVEVDQGETGCKTPDAVEHIGRAKARRAVQERKQKKSS